MSATIGLSLSTAKLQVAPGESVQATVTIRNQSQVVDQFGIRIEGLQPTWWTLSTSSVSLFPGEQAEAKLTIHPPREAEARAGSYSFQVRAVSQANPEQTTEEEAYLILRGFLVWDVEMSPTKVGGANGTYRLTATNSSNTDITLVFEGKDPEEALDYTFRHEKVTVPAGESALATLQVRPKEGQKEKLYSFQVLVKPAEAKAPSKEARTVNGQLDYQLRHWPWKWMLLGLALVAVAILIWKLVPPLVHPPAPVINSFTADPECITAGGSSLLNWDVSGADVVDINQEIGTVNSTGTCTVSPSTATTYTLTASNRAGSVTATVQVTAPPIINSFTADPTSISSGEGSTLRWDVSGATEVIIDPLTGTFALTGTRTVSPTTTTTYTLTASNEAGSRTDTVKVTVSLPDIEDFSAEPTSIYGGEDSTLGWSVSGATEVTIDHGIGSVPLTGSRTVSPTTTTTYTLEASNEAGTTTATVQVSVGLPDIHDFTASPATIAAGGSSTLSWSVSGATAVSIDHEVGNVDLTTGSHTVYPTVTITYTLRASNEAGSSTDTAKITVSPASYTWYMLFVNVPEEGRELVRCIFCKALDEEQVAAQCPLGQNADFYAQSECEWIWGPADLTTLRLMLLSETSFGEFLHIVATPSGDPNLSCLVSGVRERLLTSLGVEVDKIRYVEDVQEVQGEWGHWLVISRVQ